MATARVVFFLGERDDPLALPRARAASLDLALRSADVQPTRLIADVQPTRLIADIFSSSPGTQYVGIPIAPTCAALLQSLPLALPLAMLFVPTRPNPSLSKQKVSVMAAAGSAWILRDAFAFSVEKPFRAFERCRRKPCALRDDGYRRRVCFWSHSCLSRACSADRGGRGLRVYCNTHATLGM